MSDEPSDNAGPTGFLAEHPRTRTVLLVTATIVLVGLALQTLAEGAALIRAVLVPTAVAVLLTALLMPLMVLLNHRLKFPRTLAAAVTLLIALTVVAGLLTLAGAQIAAGIQELLAATTFELQQLKNWLTNSPLPIQAEQVDNVLTQIEAWLRNHQAEIAQEATGLGAGAANLLVATVLCLVGTFFFLAEGDRIGTWFIMLLPKRSRERVYQACRRGWVTIGTYTKTQLIVSAVDAIGIGIGAAVLGLPLVLPIIAITFILCFIPMVGAILSGAIVVLVAMTFEGLTTAIIMLVIVVAVQQLESNILSPLLMGKAVNVHPIGVLLGVATGTYLLGLIGALFAVPFLATMNTMMNYLAGRDPFPGLNEGRSALTESPKRLMGNQGKMRFPPRIGQATPDWVQGQIDLQARRMRRRRWDKTVDDEE
ncbi:AI-2E family transporter [Enemella sp. A6]|uniref:AI-2E family transporter n=1 Tax=Enemella sp. A6 TaxID=3440152 RepID=UPI003EBDDBBF